MKSDKEIWQSSFTNEETVDVFATKPGGSNAKSLPKRNLFKTEIDKKEDSRIEKLEKRVKVLESTVEKLEKLVSRLNYRSKRGNYSYEDKDKQE